ncbi:PQQ-dependent sugar dehydrogenase [Chryseolinea lacunae]|uniref:PQQ-dependent sugar dehydrogenase n=1 Tax=Chryseolinea lacunae TaxID=2801331 RepID=A0ABS1KUU5_9BACT|nr:PQQ-dependent sugar dehydrogenase [Chryseolinea lacunae]MBL0743236.1 PQQ-dependent sugar dehydrogenase [Chryseolinea lacunae]
MNKNSSSLIVLVLAMALVSCGKKESAQKPGAIVQTEKQKFRVDTITSALDTLTNPWGMAFLPDGRLLVTERSGAIRIIEDDKLLKEKIEGVPTVYVHGQGGLLDIQLHPDFSKNGWIYLSYAKQVADSGGTVIARAKLESNKLTNLEELFQALPLSSSEAHFGSRIQFDGKGYMFFTSGERGKKENAQDLSNHLGKVLRLHDDGKVPSDNPFTSIIGARSEIWSYGHRNLQGLYYDKETGTLWEHEHGPRGGDELNIVEKGKNYGWPIITYGINYDSTIITDKKEMNGLEQPVRYYVPSIAPCGMTMVTSDKYPNWKGNLLIGALSHQLVMRVEVADKKFVKDERMLEKIGRVRCVTQSPDGFIYVAMENPGKIVKLVPVE